MGTKIKYPKQDYRNQTRDTLAAQIDLMPDMFAACLLYTSPSPRDKRQSRMPSSA